ncbi:hypothetical protein ROHU_005468 [Labeo rohita]|uniref:Uncharacterized protein n=1 Tax=Labeo rohita TaxID=84645 RepID=A0A498ND71_LABRO|nr:hypothetical protein ROHU_005468 [Labeo rohita]
MEMDCDYELEMEDDNAEDIEDEESENKRPRPKARNPKRQIQYNRQMQQNRQIQHNRQGPRKVQVKVKDYLRLSVLTVTFCNCLFLGTAALIYSLKKDRNGSVTLPTEHI